MTEFFEACDQKNETRALQILDQPNIDVNMTYGAFKDNMLTYVFQHNMESVALKVLENPKINVNYQNDTMQLTILMIAFLCKMNKLISKLLDRPDVDLNLVDYGNQTALMQCINFVNIDSDNIYKFIDRPDFNPNVVDHSNNTLLTKLIYSYNYHHDVPRVVDKLLTRNDLDVTITNHVNKNALMLACEFGHIAIGITLLEKYKFNINQVDNEKRSALIWACYWQTQVEAPDLSYISTRKPNEYKKYKDPALAMKLLDCKDIDITLKDNDNKTAYDYAKENNVDGILDQLIKKFKQKIYKMSDAEIEFFAGN